MQRAGWFGAGTVVILLIIAAVFGLRGSAPPADRNLAPPSTRAPSNAAPVSPPAAAARAPSFDIVKVDPSGQAVIAGRAEPGATVRVLEGDKPLGEATADARGEWVVVPLTPLAPGEHHLALESVTRGTHETRRSEDVVALSVAPPEQPEASLAVLLPGDASAPPRLLQEPNASKGMSVDTPDGGRSYVVKRGNSLWWIARRTYGEGTRYTVIYSANRDRIRNPDLIYPGQSVKLPGS